jgi:magnesium chelatase family protein
MSLAIIFSRAALGIKAPLVSVEVHISNGLPHFSIVGLPETTVKESKDRVRSAIINSRFDFPGRKITVSLAPADLPKEGGRFDLPIAIGILAASSQIEKVKLSQYEFAGELALSGALRPIQGSLPFAIKTHLELRTLILPFENAEEASLAGELKILPAKHLLDVCHHLNGKGDLSFYAPPLKSAPTSQYPDLCDVRGQAHAKRALEIAASGGHSLLMFGPPGTGKSMLASRVPGILPELTEAEAIEVAAIASISKKDLDWTRWRWRPFRSPHHSASSVALVGGGRPPKPGEISLAHLGVLFLDELPEFDRKVIEALREPLENGIITISRAGMQAEFPSKFQLIAAMNPCPCGYLGDPSGKCHCSIEQIARYRNKISGPVLDRIDMHIEVPRLPEGLLTRQQNVTAEKSVLVRARVIKARERQYQRFAKANAHLNHHELEQAGQLGEPERLLLEKAIKKMNLSARGFHRILRVALTIADLEQKDTISTNHLSEALSYRKLDRQN